jgi:serine/threonine protein kinase
VDFPDGLPAGHRLHWYVLERVLGQGGFGITYLAHDSNLDRPVAIKEYLPTEIARRREDASARPHTEAHAERYAWGLERFLSEARTLARFDHPNIVRVLSVFEANNTAYMVMRFEEGEDLATLLERRGTLTERQLTECLLPVLDGLERVHAAGFIHRDIKPENIYVRKDGSPVLLDFGSARQSFGSAKTMTILVAPGYAPLEQYYGDAATQGPWTDIYGLGATCYRAIAGVAPLDAVARAKGVLGSAREILQPAVVAGRGRYGERLLEAVDHALKLSERDRPQSIVEWRQEIVGTAAAASTATAATSGESSLAATSSNANLAPTPALPAPAPEPVAPHAASMPPRTRRLWLGAAALCTFAAIVFYLLPGRRAEPTPPVELARAPLSTALPSSAPTATATPPQAPQAPDATTTLAPPTVAARVAVVEPPAVSGSAPRIGPDVVVAKVMPTLRSSPRTAASASPQSPAQSLPRTQASPEPVSTRPTLEPSAAPAPSALPASTVVAAAVPSATQASRTGSPAARSARDEQIDAGEAALRRGDSANAAQLLAPWAAAGVPRAQALLGRAQEARSDGQQNFEAYVWYGIAARGGLSDAQGLRDKVGAKLQPAEIRQAEQIIDHFKPRAEPTSTAERSTP